MANLIPTLFVVQCAEIYEKVPVVATCSNTVLGLTRPDNKFVQPLYKGELHPPSPSPTTVRSISRLNHSF